MGELWVEDGQKLLYIGDSITDCGRRGAEAPLGAGYVKMTCEQIVAGWPERRIEFINKGIGGHKVTDLETLDFMSGNPTTTGSNLFIRRAVLKELFGFVEGMNHAEDQLFLLQARLAGWIVAGISTPLVDYRQSDTGQSSDLEAMRHGWEQMIEMVMKTHPDEIAPLVKKARAQEMLYLSRRAMRLGIGISAALGYAKSALAANPLIVVDRSIQILAAAASTVAEYSSPKSYRVIKQEIAS